MEVEFVYVQWLKSLINEQEYTHVEYYVTQILQ